MTRKEFLKLSALLLASPFYANTISKEKNPMPALFIGHGSPMNIIRDNAFTRSLSNITKTFDKPKAIIVISAHWYEKQTLISNSQDQDTIYDFYGFPDALYDIHYEPEGNPKLADEVSKLVKGSKLEDRGLDHGAWSVLKHMYPDADIPTFQISINSNFSYMQHFEFAKLLGKLREHGVLIIGSGSVTHNLRLTNRNSKNSDTWAVAFDKFVKDSFTKKEFINIVNATYHPLFNISHPFDDHYIPLLYTAGMTNKEDKVEHFYEEIVSANLSMRCIKVG